MFEEWKSMFVPLCEFRFGIPWKEYGCIAQRTREGQRGKANWNLEQQIGLQMGESNLAPVNCLPEQGTSGKRVLCLMSNKGRKVAVKQSDLPRGPSYQSSPNYSFLRSDVV